MISYFIPCYIAGKLLFDPNLEDFAYATNVNRGGVLKLSLSTRAITSKILFAEKSVGSGLVCSRTHGISYSAANSTLYVECSNPANCKDRTYAKNCTGSMWVMNTRNPTMTSRLASPVLSKKYGDNFGIQGQPYKSPEGTFMFVPNSALNVLHVLKPMADGTTLIREVAMQSPGNIVFWPKNSEIAFGLDANPSNYVLAVAVASGVSFLDLRVVVQAFATASGVIDPSSISTVAVEGTGGYRTLRRGHNYLCLGSSYSSDGVAGKLAIVNILTLTVKYLDVAKMQSIVWVPIQSTENTAMIKSLQAKVLSLSSMSASPTSSPTKSSNLSSLASNGTIVAAIAFVISIVAVCLIIALALVVRRKSKPDSGSLLQKA